MENLKIGLILGWHPFDTIHMYPMFWKMEGITIYPQMIENFMFDYAGTNCEYDGYVFYNMNSEMPAPDTSFFGIGKTVGETLYRLGEDGKGIVMLHHSILAYPDSTLWSDITGIGKRTFDSLTGVHIPVHIEDKEHPITKGLEDWSLIDETYLMDTPDETSHMLLTTECSQSSPALGWVREYKKSRIFCFALGHDEQAFASPDFRNILERGIKWTCRRL